MECRRPTGSAGWRGLTAIWRSIRSSRFRWDNALFSRIYLRKALRHHPHHAFSYYVLGLWHQRVPKWAGGRSEKVLACLERAIALQADQTLFRIERMRWLLKNNLREEALQECRR